MGETDKMLQIQISNCFTEKTLRTTTKKGRYAIGDHLHQNTEIVYVIDGCIDVTVEGRVERAYKNDIIVIAPFRVHSFHTEEYSSVWISVFSNDFISDFLLSDEVYYYGERAVFTPSEILLNFFLPKVGDSCENLYTLEGKEYLKIKTAFSAVFEEYTRTVPQIKARPKSTALSSILSFLSEHYTENITLNDLSKRLGYSPTYISHCLDELGNINFRTILNSFRVEKAKEMLLKNKHKMIDIALECGFTCERTFYRAFLSVTGLAPGDYKEERLDAKFETLGGGKTKYSPSVHVPIDSAK